MLLCGGKKLLGAPQLSRLVLWRQQDLRTPSYLWQKSPEVKKLLNCRAPGEDKIHTEN